MKVTSGNKEECQGFFHDCTTVMAFLWENRPSEWLFHHDIAQSRLTVFVLKEGGAVVHGLRLGAYRGWGIMMVLRC